MGINVSQQLTVTHAVIHTPLKDSPKAGISSGSFINYPYDGQQ